MRIRQWKEGRARQVPSACSPRPELGTKAGQAMIVSVMALGGIFLGVTVVAGMLMMGQIRQATDFKASTYAIAAADAGIEWALFRYTSTSTLALPARLSNDATVAVRCFDRDGNELTKDGAPDCQSTELQTIVSYGEFLESSRIFEIGEVSPFAPR